MLNNQSLRYHNHNMEDCIMIIDIMIILDITIISILLTPRRALQTLTDCMDNNEEIASFLLVSYVCVCMFQNISLPLVFMQPLLWRSEKLLLYIRTYSCVSYIIMNGHLNIPLCVLLGSFWICLYFDITCEVILCISVCNNDDTLLF